MITRKWITRDEIAEIYDAMANSSSSDEEYRKRKKQANEVRATERLRYPVGDRVA